MKKKNGIDQGAGCLEADRRTEKKQNNNKCYKDPQPARQRKEKELGRDKEKKWKRKKYTKVGIHIPPSPTALEYKNKRKKDLLD